MTINNTRILNDIVSVEAWYKGFDGGESKSDLFLHVRFQEAIFGGNPEHVVRFRLHLKKADVVVVLEHPITAPRSEIRRDRLNIEAQIQETLEQNTHIQADAKAKMALNPIAPNASAEAEMSAGAKRSKQRLATSTLKHSGVLVEHSVDNEQNNRWTFSPAVGPTLLGQAFPSTERMMELEHKPKLQKIPATVKVQVKCRREDIEILDLELKTKPKGLSRGMGEDKKMKLAEEIIKEFLIGQGLEFTDVAEKFSEIVVADIIATEE